jgi:hypothetical protein
VTRDAESSPDAVRRTRQVKAAAVLWVVFAIVVWNVVFDRVLVLEGRRYVFAAATAADAHQPYVLAEPWMRAAQARGLKLATAIAAPIALFGLLAVAFVAKRRKQN